MWFIFKRYVKQASHFSEEELDAICYISDGTSRLKFTTIITLYVETAMPEQEPLGAF